MKTGDRAISTGLSKETQSAIKLIVDANGWKAIHLHPVYGPIWRKAMLESKRFVDDVVDR